MAKVGSCRPPYNQFITFDSRHFDVFGFTNLDAHELLDSFTPRLGLIYSTNPGFRFISEVYRI